MLFKDRRDAGKKLANRLVEKYRGVPDLLVLGLPRGGIPVAFEVAMALDAPLDVFVVRKIGVPDYEELAIGAIAGGGAVVWNEQLIRQLRIPGAAINAIIEREKSELARRENLYRHGRKASEIANKAVIVVDDGLATGASMRVAAVALRRLNPKRIIVAVPVAAEDTCEEFKAEVDDTVCFTTPNPFVAVGTWYDDFDQTTDREVERLLDIAASRKRAA